MPVMFRPRAAIALLSIMVSGVLLVGCADPNMSTTAPAPQDFCDAFTRLDDKLSEGNTAFADQFELVSEAVRLAPPEIRADGEKFLEGYQRIQNGEPRDVVRRDEATYEKASDNFQRWGNQHCGFYKRRGGI